MVVLLIMLVIIMEIIIASWITAYFAKMSNTVQTLNKVITEAKNNTINLLSDYRVSIKLINRETKKIQDDIKMKKLLDTLNLIASFSFLFGLKKKSICK